MKTKSLLTTKTILTVVAIVSVATIAHLTLSPNTDAATQITRHLYPTAEDIHVETYFQFRDGIQAIDYPVFDTTTNLIENTGPSFKVEGVVTKNPLLHQTIDKAWEMRRVNFLAFDWDEKYFDVSVDLTKNDEAVRGLRYNDCQIASTKVDTKFDKEAGFVAGKSFALVDETGFKCNGLTTTNPTLAGLKKGADNRYGNIIHDPHPYNMAEDTHVFATFKFRDGSEKIDFPVFNMNTKFLGKAERPEFEVKGLVGKYPLLYRAVDEGMGRSPGSTGTLKGQELFDVEIEFVRGDTVVRGLEYGDCFVSEYLVDTKLDNEDSWTTGKTGFAVEDEITLSCAGLNPTNSPYDQLHKIKYEKTTTSSLDLKKKAAELQVLLNQGN